MKHRESVAASLDGRGVLPTNVKNFTPARAVDKRPPNLAPSTQVPVPPASAPKITHTTAERTHHSIRHQPEQEARASGSLVTLFAWFAFIGGFALSFVFDGHHKLLTPQQWGLYPPANLLYPAKAFFVHVLCGITCAMLVAGGVYIYERWHSATGLARLKIKMDRATKQKEISSQAAIKRHEISTQQAIQIEDVRERRAMRQQRTWELATALQQRNRPQQHSNRLATYRPAPERTSPAERVALSEPTAAAGEASPIPPLIDDEADTTIDPVGTGVLLFTHQCYAVDPYTGTWKHLDAKGYLKQGKAHPRPPWTQRGAFGKEEMATALALLQWLRPKVWRYDEARKRWRLNLAMYPTFDDAARAINDLATVRIR